MIRAETHWLDTWLPRISHFSQFGLFVVTIGGLYFTVLPLYQKAVLEEAIARKEIELAMSEKSLEQSYVRLREFAVKEFVFGTGVQCSSLMLPPRALHTLNEKSSPTPSAAEEIFGINAGACLKDEFKTSKGLKELRPSDLQTLASHIESIAVDLTVRRGAALKEYQSVPQRAKTDPSILKPLGSYSERMLAFLSKSQLILPIPGGHSVKRIDYATEVDHGKANETTQDNPPASFFGVPGRSTGIGGPGWGGRRGEATRAA